MFLYVIKRLGMASLCLLAAATYVPQAYGHTHNKGHLLASLLTGGALISFIDGITDYFRGDTSAALGPYGTVGVTIIDSTTPIVGKQRMQRSLYFLAAAAIVWCIAELCNE